LPAFRTLSSRLLGKEWVRWLLVSMGTALLGGLVAYWAVAAYVIRRADSKVHDILMSHRGLHQYIQKDMHPSFYAAWERKEVSEDFYDPVILSSSYIVRVLHGYYNKERVKDGLPPVNYKMAAESPRNPLNQADAREANLIRMFNQDRSLTQYREVVRKGGQAYLLHAVPFLENTSACLRCHGRREDAPPGLRVLYPGSGGFNERVGYIRAVEVIQAPIHEELFGAAILSASLMGGLLTLGSLFIFNGLLRRQVKGQTQDLQREVEERRAAQDDLVDSRQKLSEAVGLARLGHWRLDVDANLFTFTDEFYRMLHTNAQVMGGYNMTPEEYAHRFLPPEDQHMVAGEIRKALESSDPFFQAQIEHRVVFADGEPGHLLVHYHVEKDEQGRTVATCGVNQDITERKTAEEETREAKAQLLKAQKLESLGCLAGGVAHDMNNVLSAILGLASANIVSQPEGSSTQRAFETIIKAAERGGKMVQGLLTYARQSPAESHKLNLNEVLEGMMRLLERTTLSKIRLVTHFEPSLHPILGDASALTHAFMNLCVNAVDAMPESGTLTLRTGNVSDEWIEVLVEDTGTGMPKEVLEKAMDPFFTTKEVGKGTGLGLSTVYSTVKAHKGTMRIQSEPGKGTRLMLCFPACNAITQAEEPAPQFKRVALQKTLNVLAVDDDELIQCTMQTLLEFLGHRVTIAPCGEDALSKIQAGLKPDVVILDMNMPGLGGAGTLQRLRILRPELPVLLATGRVDEAASDLAKAYPLVTLLPKPYSKEDLQRYLDSLVID